VSLAIAALIFYTREQPRSAEAPDSIECPSDRILSSPTRHRSGARPSTLEEGLDRRACRTLVREVTSTRREPVDYQFELLEADLLQLPGIVDSNSPAYWSGEAMMVLNSAWGETYRSWGDSADNLAEPELVALPLLERPGSVWMEATWRDPSDSTLYGWYHFEPEDLECQTAPIIGAAVSYDDGLSWENRGFVIQSAYGEDCEYDNGYFTGGSGDFSVVVGPNNRHLYFLFTNYGGPIEQQGIAIARSRIEDRGQPGRVIKYFNGAWTEAGLGGEVTALFPSSTSWKGPRVESFWGPSVHWNTYLNSYVALINHTDGEQWQQEGVYISFSRDLLNWTPPRKLLDANDWYPQVIGLGPEETDRVAGQTVRVYVGGLSVFVLQFSDASRDASSYRVAP